MADNEIVRRLDAGDLVITGDIPLAAEVLEKGGFALNPRGELYSAATIPGTPEYAGFHGYPARQRHPDRRTGRPQPERQKSPLSDNPG